MEAVDLALSSARATFLSTALQHCIVGAVQLKSQFQERSPYTLKSSTTNQALVPLLCLHDLSLQTLSEQTYEFYGLRL